MKNFNLFALVASLTLVFSSCSTNENILPEQQSEDLLKTYTIKRDATGAYSIDYSLNSSATSEDVLDENTNTKNIYLYSSANQESRKITQDLIRCPSVTPKDEGAQELLAALLSEAGFECHHSRSP